MGFIKNLRVAYKMLILAAFAVIGMLVIGYQGYSTAKKAQVDMEEMYSSSVRSIGYLSDMRYGTRYAQGMMIIMTTVKDDPQRMQNLDKKFQEGLQFVDDGIKNYEAIPGKPDVIKKELESYKSSWAALRKNLNDAVKLCQAGQMEEGRALL